MALVPENAGNQRWCHRLLECSLQDLIVLFLPHMILLAAVLIGACCVYDPTMRLLLYSALPESYQSWLLFGICFVEELRFMLMMISIAIPVWQMQVMSFDLVNTALEVIGRSKLRR